MNKQSTFLALVDSGSQLNLISHMLLPFLEYKTCPSPIKTLRGVSNTQQKIKEWITLSVVLPNGATPILKCAVVADLPCIALFGLPFLHSVNATHNIPHGILTTPAGPLVLQLGQKPSLPSAQALTTSIQESVIDVDMTNSNLTAEQKQQVLALLREYDDLWRGERRGKVVEIEHRIRLLTDRPVVVRPRPITAEQKQIVVTEINKMLADGVIRPSESPYASEAVLVPKKTGDWRFCVDFRALNKITVKDKYPLPRISELIHAIQGSRYFAALDLRAGYWQVPMEKTSIKYTAFRCFMGLYEFLFMPFGLTNAPATFQRVIDFLFGDLRFSGVLCYLDDILVHAQSFPQCLSVLRQVFDRLRAAGLTLNIQKSNFFPRRLKYLGQLIVDGHLIPDPQKVEALHRIPPPATITEVRSLLGFVGFYQAFIPQYAELLMPVFDLLRAQKNTKRMNKATSVSWTEQHQAAVKEVIARLEKSVLEIPADSDEFMIETDASANAIAAVLNVKHDNQWKPAEFYSKTLTKTQQNWPAREREAFAIVAALQKFDCYVRGRPLTIFTDHESLKWMTECQKGKIARWMSLLAEYDLKIFHKSGTELAHIDFLTRHLNPAAESIVQDRMCYFTSTMPIPSLQEITQSQKESVIPSSPGFSKKDNIVYYHGLMYVPLALQLQVIAACHSVAPFHHPGVKKTKATIQRVFNWPGLHQDVARYVQSCLYCQRCRSGREKLQGFLRSHPVPGAFHTVYMDMWQCTYNQREYTLLTLVDQGTKWAECVIIPNKEAETIASTLLCSWIYRFGVPAKLISDQDPSFCNAVLTHISARLGITRLTSTVYHPEGNAVIESFHRTLALGLRHINQSAVPFEEALGLVLFGYRATMHSTTGHSPCYLTFGLDPRVAPDCDWRLEGSPLDQERLKFLSTLRLDVQFRAQQAVNQQNAKKNEARQPSKFEEGQLVLCRLVPLEQLRYRVARYKIIPRWTLPHRVVRVLPSQKAAIVSCVISGRLREVHIQDVTFVLPPQGEVQRQEWQELLTNEVKTMFDPATYTQVIQEFFQTLERPQRALSTTRGKRYRAAESGGAMVGLEPHHALI